MKELRTDELVVIARINDNVVCDFYYIIDKMSDDEFKALCTGQEYPPNGWISVKDRLPTVEDCKYGRYMECLLYFADTGEVWAGEFNEYLLKGNNNADINVTHWQPLPAPPMQKTFKE